MRKTMLSAAVLLCCALLAACSGGGADGATAQSQPDRNGTITFLDPNPPPNGTMDPRTAKNDSGTSQSALYAVYDRLVGFDPSGNPIPQLATEWSLSSDLKSVALSLREGVRFHDGEVLDSEAVKANLEKSRTLTTDVGPTLKAAAAEISSVDTPSPTQVVIHLNVADGGFVYNLGTQLGMMISPRALDGLGLQIAAVGAGPFKLESFTPNQTTTLVRNDDYWGGPGDRPMRLVMKYVTDENTRLSAVRSGQATVTVLAPQQISAAKSAGLEVKVNPSGARWILYLRTDRALKDPLVRQALMYALNREAIAKALSFGTSAPTVQLIPEGQPGHVEGAEQAYPYDPQKARDLLAQAGYPTGLTLGFELLNLSDHTQMFDAVSQQLKDAGITLDVKKLDISQALPAFLDGSGGDVWMSRWGGRADPLQTLQINVGAGGTYTPGGVVSQELEDAIGTVRSLSTEDPARADALAKANQLAIDSAATVPIIDRSFVYGYKKGCISHLDQYLAAGSNDWRDVTVGVGCS